MPNARRLTPMLAAALAGVVVWNAPAVAESLPGPIPAEVTEIYDGDTITVTAEIWPDQFIRTKVRINGIDTPELRAACEREKELAAAARDRIAELIGAKRRVTLMDVQFGKYAGRVVARVNNADGLDLAHAMIRDGLAVPYNGGARKPWCP